MSLRGLRQWGCLRVVSVCGSSSWRGSVLVPAPLHPPRAGWGVSSGLLRSQRLSRRSLSVCCDLIFILGVFVPFPCRVPRFSKLFAGKQVNDVSAFSFLFGLALSGVHGALGLWCDAQAAATVPQTVVLVGRPGQGPSWWVLAASHFLVCRQHLLAVSSTGRLRGLWGPLSHSREFCPVTWSPPRGPSLCLVPLPWG